MICYGPIHVGDCLHLVLTGSTSPEVGLSHSCGNHPIHVTVNTNTVKPSIIWPPINQPCLKPVCLFFVVVIQTMELQTQTQYNPQLSDPLFNQGLAIFAVAIQLM